MTTYFKRVNPHPEGKNVRDCVKRAITLATGKPYKEVALELNRHKKLTGADNFNDNTNWKSYVKNVLNGIYISFPAVKGLSRMSGKTFAEQYRKGSYVLVMAGHLAACVDGTVLDSWDSTDKCVYGAWRVNGDVEASKNVKSIRRII